jgi:hypothetical protein
MRVFEEKKNDGSQAPKSNKKVLSEGRWYNGGVESQETISFPTSRGTGYALKLKVKPEDSEYFATTAFDFIGMDETGPYIQKGSKMETWLKVIFGVSSLEKVVLAEIKDKKLAFKVKNETRQWKDKKTGETSDHLCADIVEVALYGTSSDDLTAEDFKDQKAPAAKPSTPPAASVTPPAKTPVAASASAGKKASKWDDEETL